MNRPFKKEKKYCKGGEITLRRGFSPVYLLYIFFRTPFLRSIFGGLLLDNFNQSRSILNVKKLKQKLRVLLNIECYVEHYQFTAQKMKFYIKDFFSKCDQVRSFLRIWSHLLKKSLGKHHFLCCDFWVLNWAND